MLKTSILDTIIRARTARGNLQALAKIYADRIGYDPVEDDPTATAEDLFEILRDWCLEAVHQDDSLTAEQERAAVAAIRDLMPEGTDKA